MTTPLRRPATSQNRFESGLLRSKVRQIIKRKSFAIGQFTLASGKVSNFYLDMKPTMYDPEGSVALAQMIRERIAGMNVDYVGGLALGALPLISVLNMISFQENTPVPGFFVRKEVKNHGTKKLVEGLAPGESLQGKNVVILDDVTTTGESAMIAVRAAQDSGATVSLVLAIVDREEGAVDFYKQQGVPFGSLFTATEFMAD